MFYKQVEVTRQPNLLAGGPAPQSNRYAAKLDAIEARRIRREQSNTRSHDIFGMPFEQEHAGAEPR